MAVQFSFHESILHAYCASTVFSLHTNYSPCTLCQYHYFSIDQFSLQTVPLRFSLHESILHSHYASMATVISPYNQFSLHTLCQYGSLSPYNQFSCTLCQYGSLTIQSTLPAHCASMVRYPYNQFFLHTVPVWFSLHTIYSSCTLCQYGSLSMQSILPAHWSDARQIKVREIGGTATTAIPDDGDAEGEVGRPTKLQHEPQVVHEQVLLHTIQGLGSN